MQPPRLPLIAPTSATWQTLLLCLIHQTRAMATRLPSFFPKQNKQPEEKETKFVAESKMSGGVGPTYSDIILPKDQEEHEQEQKQLHDTAGIKNPPSSATKSNYPPAGGFLSFRQLNSLAVLIVFSASGLVSLDDVAFVVLSFFYIYFLSKMAFPPKNGNGEDEGGSLTSPNYKRVFRLYVAVSGVVGLLIPICYIFHGMFEGDQNGIKAAAPHVFLLASQVFMEGVASSRGFSGPIRILVPVFYNARRIITLTDWVRNEFIKEESETESITQRRLYVGKVLALVNMAIWSFNLFGVLLPIYLPKAFKRYYGGNIKQN